MSTPTDSTEYDPLKLTGVWERAQYPDVCIMRNEAGCVTLSISLQEYGHSYQSHGEGPPLVGYVNGPGASNVATALVGGAGGKIAVVQSAAIKAARAAGYAIPVDVPHAR